MIFNWKKILRIQNLKKNTIKYFSLKCRKTDEAVQISGKSWIKISPGWWTYFVMYRKLHFYCCMISLTNENFPIKNALIIFLSHKNCSKGLKASFDDAILLPYVLIVDCSSEMVITANFQSSFLTDPGLTEVCERLGIFGAVGPSRQHTILQ